VTIVPPASAAAEEVGTHWGIPKNVGVYPTPSTPRRRNETKRKKNHFYQNTENQIMIIIAIINSIDI